METWQEQLMVNYIAQATQGNFLKSFTRFSAL
jgi:hypothetical protein